MRPYAQKDGTIRREVCFPESASEWVISGPHFFVGNPFYKTPRAEVTNNSHYDVLDLLDLPEDYLPRTIYVPNVGPAEYRSRSPKVPWAAADGKDSVLDYFRVVVNNMIGPTSERSLQPSMAPRGMRAHQHRQQLHVRRCAPDGARWLQPGSRFPSTSS